MKLKLGLALCLSLGLTACAAAHQTAEGDAYFEKGRFAEALRAYETAAAESPDNATVQQKLRVGRIFAWMDEGRSLVFAGEMFKALERFRAVLEIDPGNETALMWIDKTQQKIVKQKVQQGYDWIAEESYEMATEAFREAMLLSPKNEDAMLGLDRIRMALDRELLKSQNYYLRGVRDKAANLLYQADANFDKSHLYDPNNPEVVERGKQVKHQLAEQKFLDAKRRESEKHYGAALVGYRAVRSIDPDYPELAERIANAEIEMKADDLYRRGRNSLSRGEFEQARKSLTDARQLTKLENLQNEIDQKLEEVKDREVATLYLSANAAEQLGNLEEALNRYQKILQQVSFYQDAITRQEWLSGVVQKATSLYEQGSKAEEQGNTDEALKAYQQVAEIYPKYRDVKTKLDRLQKKN